MSDSEGDKKPAKPLPVPSSLTSQPLPSLAGIGAGAGTSSQRTTLPSIGGAGSAGPQRPLPRPLEPVSSGGSGVASLGSPTRGHGGVESVAPPVSPVTPADAALGPAVGARGGQSSLAAAPSLSGTQPAAPATRSRVHKGEEQGIKPDGLTSAMVTSNSGKSGEGENEDTAPPRMALGSSPGDKGPKTKTDDRKDKEEEKSEKEEGEEEDDDDEKEEKKRTKKKDEPAEREDGQDSDAPVAPPKRTSSSRKAGGSSSSKERPPLTWDTWDDVEPHITGVDGDGSSGKRFTIVLFGSAVEPVGMHAAYSFDRLRQSGEAKFADIYIIDADAAIQTSWELGITALPAVTMWWGNDALTVCRSDWEDSHVIFGAQLMATWVPFLRYVREQLQLGITTVHADF